MVHKKYTVKPVDTGRKLNLPSSTEYLGGGVGIIRGLKYIHILHTKGLPYLKNVRLFFFSELFN